VKCKAESLFFAWLSDKPQKFKKPKKAHKPKDVSKK